jgi:quercetin dioxygenase-like cupin family protein
MTRFSFDLAAFLDVHAHGAATTIRSARVLERDGGPGCRFVDLCEVPPGAEIAEHTHGPGDEEIYVIVEGNAAMTVDGVELVVGRGDVIVNRPGGTHSLRNVGTEPLLLVVVDTAAPET